MFRQRINATKPSGAISGCELRNGNVEWSRVLPLTSPLTPFVSIINYHLMNFQSTLPIVGTITCRVTWFKTSSTMGFRTILCCISSNITKSSNRCARYCINRISSILLYQKVSWIICLWYSISKFCFSFTEFSCEFNELMPYTIDQCQFWTGSKLMLIANETDFKCIASANEITLIPFGISSLLNDYSWRKFWII